MKTDCCCYRLEKIRLSLVKKLASVAAMFSFIRHAPLTRHLLVWLALAGMMFYAMIPPGYMPSFGTTGSMTMVICSDQGAVEIVVDVQPGQTNKKHTDKKHHTPCAFALVGVANGPVPPVVMPLPPAIFLIIHRVLEQQLRLTHSRFADHTPRGPPLFSLN